MLQSLLHRYSAHASTAITIINMPTSSEMNCETVAEPVWHTVCVSHVQSAMVVVMTLFLHCSRHCVRRQNKQGDFTVATEDSG